MMIWVGCPYPYKLNTFSTSGATAVQLMHNHLAAQQEQFSSDSNCNTYFPFLPPPGGPRDQYSMHSLSSAIQVQFFRLVCL